MKTDNRLRIIDLLDIIDVMDGPETVKLCTQKIREILDEELDDLSDEFVNGYIVDGPAPYTPGPSNPSKVSNKSTPSDIVPPADLRADLRDYLLTLDVGRPAGYYLDELRNHFDLTVKQLAELFGVSTRMILKILAGADSPTVCAAIDALLEGK